MSKDVHTAVAEMSGIHLCEGPGCFRQLRGGQGRVLEASDKKWRVCFSPGCVEWAERVKKIFEVS